MTNDLTQEPLDGTTPPGRPIPGGAPETEPLAPGSDISTPDADRDAAVDPRQDGRPPLPTEPANTAQ
ncbi:hypothetical protein [Chitinasiproducens palmae]|uniref:Uncharacterized protein n=1 Tax=Chitinasiproducens palmae TaxID=1770053 RepID=A0A1H2PS46_9BURK|nr:hypothetical protein [Chitinasiproducens palmae]SDV49765.1 hypothetical protein SAMN05216551_109117 [Chitinasiproducens palmae]